MKTLIKKKTTISDKDNLILICDKNSNLKRFDFSKSELSFIVKQQKDKKEIIVINQLKPVEQQVRALARGFSRLDTSQIYMKPAIREFIES